MADDEPPLSTNELWFWVTELRAGRPNAAEPTFRKIVARVEALAGDMFRKFPRVGRFVALDDVVQNSLVRLLRALREVRPQSRHHFYALANELVRRELLDLVKHYFGPCGAGTNLADVPVGDGAPDPAAADPDLEKAAAFHEAVAELPPAEREVIGLIYYQNWPLPDIANLFGVSVRTVQRWRDAAVAKLRERVGDW
ncbi:MAG: sigma-70 family RNA polymerase sigma factor [Gemmataceae bacterium]